ncbi:Uncharacterised protein [Sphingobacterium spiritivorum]|uniref:Uncharacterized protein n=1 Tax=Sphingobacterium spiritivorum TaxID=258 RepID=A0A380B9N6_SPHSI|nr:Uncharacterised protein [Sphingobacterium spiritivorum]
MYKNASNLLIIYGHQMSENHVHQRKSFEIDSIRSAKANKW